MKWLFLLAIVCGFIAAAASGLGLPMMSKTVFPILFGEHSKESDKFISVTTHLFGDVTRDQLLFVACLGIPVIFLFRTVAGYLNAVLVNYCGLRVSEGIRVDIFEKLQSLPLSFFKRNKSGDLLARLMGDVELLRQCIAQASSDLIEQPATMLFAIGALVWFAITSNSFLMVLIALLTIPLCVLLIRSMGNKMAKRARSLQGQGGNLSAALTDSLQSPLEIRAYNLQQRQIDSFKKAVRLMLNLSTKVVRYRQVISPSIELVASAGIAFALFFGVKNGMTLNSFLFAGTALYTAYGPVKKLGMIHSLFKQGEAALERMEYILHAQDTLPDAENPREIVRPKQGLKFENLTFAYGEEPVLREVNVDVPVGQVVALVGHSGAGKTTFAHLIPRFYDPQQGSVRLDGIDIREFSKKDLRSQIAVVPQVPALFSGSIAENIRIGKLDATDEEVIDAARRAFAHDFILKQPNAYQTDVGERGDLLSGGQRQRIAIARAFLRNAPILVLDEATSALDSESEAMVQKALAELVKGRTTFIIAHRFSTITIADRVLVFEHGRIIADGSHAQLRATDSTYQKMLRSQGFV